MNKILKMFIGEPMPDKNDPKYKEKYEHDVAAGRKFAQRLRIDKAVNVIQRFADKHRKLFLVLVFGFVTGCFIRNIVLLTRSQERQETNISAIDRQERVLQQKLNKKKKVTKPYTITTIQQKKEKESHSDTIKVPEYRSFSKQ